MTNTLEGLYRMTLCYRAWYPYSFDESMSLFLPIRDDFKVRSFKVEGSGMFYLSASEYLFLDLK